MDGHDIVRLLERMIEHTGIEAIPQGRACAAFVTPAAQKKVPEVDIMRVTGHRSMAVLRSYVRRRRFLRMRR